MSTSNETETALATGREHLKAGRYTEATVLLRDIAKKEPSNETAWQLLGGALSQQSDWPGAVGALRKALELNPAEVRNYYNLAVALKEGLGRLHDARLYLERGLEHDPSHEPSRKLLRELTPLTDAPDYDQRPQQQQQQEPLFQGAPPLTTGRVALGVGAGVAAALLSILLWFFIKATLGVGGILVAIGSGWLIGLATAKGCGQGGKVPAQIAAGVAALFLTPVCLLFGLGNGVDWFRILIYGLSLFFGVQRAYLTARSI